MRDYVGGNYQENARQIKSDQGQILASFVISFPQWQIERSRRHASANDEKWNANDCTDSSQQSNRPITWRATPHVAVLRGL